RRVRGRELGSLPRDVAARMAPDLALPSGRAEIEPLYVQLLRRWRKYEPVEDPPEPLQALAELWLKRLPPSRQRTIQAPAVVGHGALRAIAEMLPRPEDLDEAVRPLADDGVIDVVDGSIRLKNAVVGRLALAMAPSGAVADLHARACAAVPDEPFTVEL